MTREEIRAKLNEVIKVLQQIDKDLVLDEEEKEALIDDAYGLDSDVRREVSLDEPTSGGLTIDN